MTCTVVWRFVKYFVWALGTVVAVLIVAELLVRFNPAGADTVETYTRRYIQTVDDRIQKSQHLNDKGDNPFVPAFTVFLNENITSEERMRTVFSSSTLEASQTWKSYDFLQSTTSKASTIYTVHSNSLGFRGRERTAAKPPHTYRIIVLGSYQAFGYGVNDDETYEVQLERALNKKHPGTSFEVWNGGRVAGTAIVGLARMKYEIFAYEPDLLILDYGIVDTNLLNDSYVSRALHLPPWPTLVHTEQRLLSLLNKSLLWKMAWGTYYQRWVRNFQLKQYKTTMREILTLANDKQVPVVIVREPWGVQVAEYKDIVESSVPVVDVAQSFISNPPVYPAPEEWKRGAWGRTWLNELDPRFTSKGQGEFSRYPYELDLYQLNAYGQAAVARALLPIIEGKFRKSLNP